MFKKFVFLVAFILTACSEEQNPHANFPRVQKGPATLTRSVYVDSIYHPVEKQFFAYDDLGRITNHKIFTLNGEQQQLTNEIKYIWGEGKNLISIQDKDTRKTFTYSKLDIVIPRIKDVTVHKLINGEWQYDYQLSFDFDNQGKLNEVFKYSTLLGPIARTVVESDYEKGRQTITEYLKIGNTWDSINTVHYTYNQTEPDHLHGLKIVESSSFKTEYELDINSAAVGWQSFTKFDGVLIPRERAFINTNESGIITRVEEIDPDKLIWNPSYMIEVVYTANGSSLIMEGPWNVDVQAHTIVSGELSINFRVARCM
jgi:hypothetical protein